MTYAGQQTILDADSHVMELGDFLDPYLDEGDRALLNRAMFDALHDRLDTAVANAEARRTDAQAAAEAEERLLKDKGWMAMGGWDPAERTRVLDLLGFDAQLVFGTFGTLLYRAETASTCTSAPPPSTVRSPTSAPTTRGCSPSPTSR